MDFTKKIRSGVNSSEKDHHIEILAGKEDERVIEACAELAGEGTLSFLQDQEASFAFASHGKRDILDDYWQALGYPRAP